MSLPDQSAFNEAAPDADQPRFPHQFFERSVRRFPDQIALDVPPGTGRPARRRLTYAELDRKAEAVAARLRSMLTGAGAPGECVAAILLPRSGAELYAAQLGALKAGAAHAPIDPAFPDEQMRDILEDSDAVAILTDDEGAARASPLEGTLLLAWYLRAMGMEIGRRVLIGPGFAHVVDPDMLHFEDDSTVSCQFQAHTFEDRVLKIDHVRIRRQATVGGNAVLLYGADIGARTLVAPHSVVMKRETLLPGRVYAGCPSRAIPASARGSRALRDLDI